MAPDPISALRGELKRLEKRREDLLGQVVKFRRKHKVTDEQCKAMIDALARGQAKTIEEAWKLTAK